MHTVKNTNKRKRNRDADDFAQKRKKRSKKTKARTKGTIKRAMDRIDQLEATIATLSSTPNVPVLDQTDTTNTLQERLKQLSQFQQIQSKKNDIYVNLFVIIIHELSLKLNMKGRSKETRDENALPLGRDKLCALKLIEDLGEPEFIINDVAATVLEAAAISLSGQTVTSVDDKNMHRVKQIQEFKACNNIPLNGLVSLQKNVTRFNQDAGLACNMTLGSKMESGMHICFGTENERLAMQYLSLAKNGHNCNAIVDAGECAHTTTRPEANFNTPQSSFCTECNSEMKNNDEEFDLSDIADFAEIHCGVGN